MRLFSVVNITLAALIALTALIFLLPAQEEDLVIAMPRPMQKELPKSPFGETEEYFEEIGEGILSLVWVPPQMQLPDLRKELIYNGKNCRPDALLGRASFHLSLRGSGERALINEGARVYLVYQGNFTPKFLKAARAAQQNGSSAPFGGETASPASVWGERSTPLWGETHGEENNERGCYVFSPGNQATPLWFEIKAAGENLLEVRVHMLDEKGVLVVSPTDFRSFPLHAQEFPKSQTAGWDIGGYRVDTTLLVRQKARWIGADRFLEMHGGEEFSYTIGRERIDFLEGEEPYSCFVCEGDYLVWEDEKWCYGNSLDNTGQLPLLVVKKIDEKIMTFELWDPEGKGKTILSLIRTKDHQLLPNVSQELKFVGAKTWAQFIVESKNGGRLNLKLHDWLVLTQEGWMKLDAPEKIDAFVAQHITGPLFILDKMTKQNGRQVLMGHLFNATRTEVEEVELTASSTTSIANYYRHIPINPPIMPATADITVEGSERCE